jgi:membrane protease YdiL (CAAX protease family)
MSTTISPVTPPAPAATAAATDRRSARVPLLWVGFVVAALLALDVLDAAVWSVVAPLAAGALWLGTTRSWRSPSGTRPGRLDRRDLGVIAVLYLAVVGLFRLAFTVFTTDRLLGLFLSFAGGLVLGVAGPIVYTVWLRRRPLRCLGLGTQRLPATVALGLLFAGAQAASMLWGYRLPAPVDWVPLLVMSLTVGLFEAVFFRGFVQGRLQASLGTGPAVAGAAGLYALYHLGYGMGAGELAFLFALGVVYAIAYRLVDNILVLWPLLTPLGGWFSNLQDGDIQLPWASIAGFADVLAVMALVIWLAQRRQRRQLPPGALAAHSAAGPHQRRGDVR